MLFILLTLSFFPFILLGAEVVPPPRSIMNLLQEGNSIRIVGNTLDLSHKRLTSISDLNLLKRAIQDGIVLPFLHGKTSTIYTVNIAHNWLKKSYTRTIKRVFPTVTHIILNHNRIKTLQFSGLEFGDTIEFYSRRPPMYVEFNALFSLPPINIQICNSSLTLRQIAQLKEINTLLQQKNKEDRWNALGVQTTVSTLIAGGIYAINAYYAGHQSSSQILNASLIAGLPIIRHAVQTCTTSGYIKTCIDTFKYPITGLEYPFTDRYNGHNLIIVDSE